MACGADAGSRAPNRRQELRSAARAVVPASNVLSNSSGTKISAAIRQLRLGREDADDGVRPAAERHRSAKRTGIAAEHSLPQALAQDRDVGAAGRFSSGRNVRPDAARRSPRKSNRPAVTRPVVISCGSPMPVSVRDADVERLDLLEHLRVLAHAHEVRRRKRRVLRAVGIEHLQVVQAIGVAVGQRFEQHAVHHAEDRAVGADAERERDQRRGGKRRRAAQHAEGVADVLRAVR